ncbi:cyclophilin peptidyl-prolyl cis-trans isomerase Cyp8 [Coniosporium tulheliwenetii]|uniref:Cyclophilin peptidyl-prolyl cis-trans isomerase Cyp8 n=1 Tax=Coniosporium tulheliwenetii TaxID=3383036 RepID=A0ACC2YUQ0_9PEZI|nr:cyclophilin peptidyl-prolyl cis-trans isomerase Cyp8 [Cladosporium sp. JES 115]
MGKGTDKLYITHSEWSSEDAYSASHGSGVSKSKVVGASFKRLPFNFCSLSLQPFEHPVCTANGTIFDLTNILPWLKKHGTNPVDGSPLKSSELIKLNFAKNDDGEYVDPVTYKVFTDNTHIVALRNSGNVFAWDTIERLNIKAKNWRDLVSDAEFTRKDIITLQDPQNIEARDLSSFKYLKEGTSTLTEEQEQERNDPANNVNATALGSAAKILKAKEAVARARAERAKANDPNRTSGGTNKALAASRNGAASTSSLHPTKPVPYNAAQYTTGKAAASFTSTGVTPHTSGERALLTDEEYMLKPRRIKQKGYARLQTNLGSLNLELLPEYSPRAVWNFVQLAKKGYYRNLPFHRNIRNFMLQGGDPTGTGRGGQSIWGKPFADEFDGPLSHDARGVLSMANKGKNTNTSQFFVTYRPAKHLDRKHTIFGRVVGGLEVLDKLENVKTDEKDRPTEECVLEDVVVFVDPFEEFLKQRSETEAKEKEKEEVIRQGGTEDDRTTWTGKRVRGDGTVEQGSGGGGVGKYLKAAMAEQGQAGEDEIVGEWEESAVQEPAKKKAKAGGFGNFDSW